MNFKNALTLFCLICLGFAAQAQGLNFPDLDKSALDAAHYPRTSAYNNYMDADDKKDPMVKVLYSRPKKNDRVIFGELVPYGEEWRLGANEATEVEFYQAVEIGGQTLNPGYYTMFADVYPTHWVVKLSSERFIAGNNNRDKSKDVVSLSIPVEQVASERESFTIGFKKIDDNNCHMIFAWDDVQAALPIGFNPAFLDTDNSSPMDLVQFPANSRMRNSVKKEELEASKPKIRVVFSRPQKKDRDIFGGLLAYGEPWRMGANETTEITFFQDATVGGEKVSRGRYGIYAVPQEGKWDIVIHRNLPSWGTAYHDESTNVATFSVPTKKTSKTVENFSILLEQKVDQKVYMIVAWDNTMVEIPIEM
ncbi:MAG: DUF2911 domain-containing protein [Bacteroidota bacterium]